MVAFPTELDALRMRWLARRDELRRLRALVDGAELCDALLADLDAALRAEHSALLSLREASRVCGYSADHLGRLVRAGILPNAGRRNAPRVRLADLPRRAGASGSHDDLTLRRDSIRSRVQIARSVLSSKPQEQDDD